MCPATNSSWPDLHTIKPCSICSWIGIHERKRERGEIRCKQGLPVDQIGRSEDAVTVVQRAADGYVRTIADEREGIDDWRQGIWNRVGDRRARVDVRILF